MIPFCECGCEIEVTRSKLSPYDWNKYISGHNTRGYKFGPHSEETKNKIAEAAKRQFSVSGSTKVQSLLAKKQWQDPKFHKSQTKILKDYWRLLGQPRK